MTYHKTTSMPVTVILADQPIETELQATLRCRETAALMIAGSTVIEHLLMELQDLRVQHCIVMAGENADEVRALVGDPHRWGMTIEVMNDSISVEQSLREFKSFSEPDGLLVVEANCLRSRCLRQFLTCARCSDYNLLEAVCETTQLGITLLKPTSSDFVINAMPIVCDEVEINPLRNLHDFHRANFDVVGGRFQGLDPGVRLNTQVGRRQHWASHVHQGPGGRLRNVMIDKHCMVGKAVTMDSVILHQDVYVENGADLKNTIAMPNSIVCAGAPIANAIINNGMVYQLS